jgi:AcrR family transcriptional regulator
MPKNRRDRDLGQKRNEIVAVARRLLIEDGYEATRMSHIAAAAGVAPNTLYWYFQDKDELLIAVLDDLVAKALDEYAEVQASALETQLLWMLSKFEAARALVTTVHTRRANAAAIQAWHERFHHMVEEIVAQALVKSGVPRADHEASARIFVFVLEGLLSHHAGDRAVCESVARLLAARLEGR